MRSQQVRPGDAPTLDEVRRWPATVAVQDATRALGIGRSYGYALAATDELPVRTIRVGGRIRVITASLIALLEGQDNDGEGAA